MNIGAPWPDLLETEQRVLTMQNKLHRWAASDAGRAFDDLHNLVYDPAFLVVAWNRVLANKGARSAGIDGIIPSKITDIGAWLADLQSDLKARRFRPDRLRERMIPKRGGNLRRLGIPTTADRVAPRTPVPRKAGSSRRCWPTSRSRCWMSTSRASENCSARPGHAKRRREGVAAYRLVRYADDFVVMVAGTRADCEALWDEVGGVLGPAGLRLSVDKSRVCHIDEGLTSSGFASSGARGTVGLASERSTPIHRSGLWPQ